MRTAVLLLLTACAGSSDTTPPSSQQSSWSDAEKCEHMCQSYCVHKNMCDGSSIDGCRMALDHAGGGTCTERANLFTPVSQAQVQACIDAIQAMSCTDFLEMYDTGKGVPAACDGILI